MLSEVQWFVSETLNRPWPARPQLDDPGCLLQHSPARSRVAESGGFIIYRGKTARAPSRLSSRFHLKDVAPLRVLMFRGRPRQFRTSRRSLGRPFDANPHSFPVCSSLPASGLPSQS